MQEKNRTFFHQFRIVRIEMGFFKKQRHINGNATLQSAKEKKSGRKYSEQRFLTFHQMPLCYFINFSPRCCWIFFRAFSLPHASSGFLCCAENRLLKKFVLMAILCYSTVFITYIASSMTMDE